MSSRVHVEQTPQKIPMTLSMTERQLNALRGPAKRLEITVQDLIRRLVDQWIEEEEAQDIT